MRSARRSLVFASLALLLASGARAETVTTKERARLRQGPSAATELLGEVEPNTKLEVLGESGGWRQVRTPDGRVGYVWSDHLTGHEAEQRPAEQRPAEQKPTEQKPAEQKPAPTPPPAPVRTLADDVRELREEVSALRTRPEPATAADLERLRKELEQVAAAEREVAHRLDDRFTPPPVPADPPSDGTATFTLGLLFLGAVVGFIASRLLQPRRDWRQRNRLRL